MTNEQIKEMILKLIEWEDYDLYKFYLPECSEDPDAAEQSMAELIEIAKAYIVPAQQDLRNFVELAAAPKRRDGTYNHSREALEKKAKKLL